MAQRTAFFVSDSTGITAETFGLCTLKQFDLPIRHIRLPFIDTPDKARRAAEQINKVMEIEHLPPIVFSTLAVPEISTAFRQDCRAVLFDLFESVVEPMEKELGIKSNQNIGRFSDVVRSKEYETRMEAINFSLEHDDGQTHRNLQEAEIILVGVSRSGKTPTSLYLAMQHGIKTANYPLIPEDFERDCLPASLLEYRNKLYGLTIDPIRLSEIRNQRRPNSKYADLNNCRYEVAAAETLMRRENIHFLSTTGISIEEIATKILQIINPKIL
ncbi:MAG: kinase/pyrophosphorylase [Commensalibacter sp.]|nr:kinase/pyrophosphorylase [Commensalibacter sp.]